LTRALLLCAHLCILLLLLLLVTKLLLMTPSRGRRPLLVPPLAKGRSHHVDAAEVSPPPGR
jgi:hypothetical protein